MPILLSSANSNEVSSFQHLEVNLIDATRKLHIVCGITIPAFNIDDNDNIHRVPVVVDLGIAAAGLVNFHPTRQPIAAGPNHRAPQLMQPGPGGPITTQSEDSLQTQCAGAILLHKQLGAPTVADGILEGLVHNAHRIEMRGAIRCARIRAALSASDSSYCRS
jgi:hypothetical protein